MGPGRLRAGVGGDAVDFPALDALVEAQIAGGVSGLVPCGTTGESPTLTDGKAATNYVK